MQSISILHTMKEPDLLISIICMVVTCLLSQIFRSNLQKRFKGLLGILTTEFVAMFELCATCYECGVVLQHHGTGAYFVCLYGLCLFRSFYWHEVNACPYSYLEEWLNGKFHAVTVILTTMVQLLGGSFVYHYYTKLIWSLELREAHKGRYDTFRSCQSDVQVFLPYAAFIEAITVFVCLVSCKAFSQTTKPPVFNFITSFLISCLVVGALGISGGYMNPALASVLQYGCTGSTLMEQFLVYWVANTSGAVLAYYFWNYVQKHPTLKPISLDESLKLKRG